jgi:hypothetical protein
VFRIYVTSFFLLHRRAPVRPAKAYKAKWRRFTVPEFSDGYQGYKKQCIITQMPAKKEKENNKNLLLLVCIDHVLKNGKLSGLK